MKQHPDTRHLPVVVVGEDELRLPALRAGARAFLSEHDHPQELPGALARIAEREERGVRRLHVLQDRRAGEDAAALGLAPEGEDVELVLHDTEAQAFAAVDAGDADCLVLDLAGAAVPSLRLLRRLERQGLDEQPVVALRAGALTEREQATLEQAIRRLRVKVADSPDRLLYETALFLERPESELPAEARSVLARLRTAEPVLRGRKVLVVDDDVRNVFALTSVLEEREMDVVFAENGREGIERLREHPDVDLVLLDVMMPELDGYEAARAIRAMPEFERLPIISLTAKAMRGDRDKSIAAGASDYITKPVDVDQLLSLMRVWLLR